MAVTLASDWPTGFQSRFICIQVYSQPGKAKPVSGEFLRRFRLLLEPLPGKLTSNVEAKETALTDPAGSFQLQDDELQSTRRPMVNPSESDELLLYLRIMLNFLGLDPHAWGLVTANSGGKKKNGRHRSLVRQIGSSLPLRPVRRAHFQIVDSHHYSRRHGRASPFIDDDSEPVFIASLADVAWVDACSPEKNARGRSEFRPFVSRRKSLRTPRRRRTCFVRRRREPDIDELPDVLQQTPPPSSLSLSHRLPSHSGSVSFSTPSALDASTPVLEPSALEKIGQLEDELSKLRAQIAMIVTAQSQQTVTGAVQVTPAPPPPPPCGGLAPPPPPPCGGLAPPPPPPPPPPPLPTAPTHGVSVAEQIRKNRAKKGQAVPSASQTGSGQPNMADVLKGLGTVKLRTVARSPGGTPIRQKPRPATANDAAALIAQALKRKFARHRVDDSPDKENRAWATPSPNKGSPSMTTMASPKFGQHLLKSSKLAQVSRPSRPLAEVNV